MQPPISTTTTTTNAAPPLLRVTAADHISMTVRDLDETLAFYGGVFGLTIEGIEEYRAGRTGIVTLRVSDSFVLHVRPDADAARPVDNDNGYDHLCLAIAGIAPDTLLTYLRDNDVEIEGGTVLRDGARGDGTAIYLNDPDGYRVELTCYP